MDDPKSSLTRSPGSPTPGRRVVEHRRGRRLLIVAAYVLLVVAIVAMPAHADITPTVEDSGAVRILILLSQFILTLVIEGLIVIPPLRKQVKPLWWLFAVFAAANAISFAGLSLAFLSALSYNYDTAYLIGETAVAVFEGAFVAGFIKKRLVPERAAVRARPFVAVFVLVVLANVVTALISVPLGQLR